MAKKDKNKEVVFSPDNGEVKVDDEPMFDAEAYGSPQPEAGSDVTVMKTVGIGGPVPIVAPKHNTVQLQPIVVPLAVVPYMTQDSSVLRTDGKQQGGYMSSSVDGDVTEFENIEDEKIKKKVKVQPRIFALVTFIVSLLTLLPFLIGRFATNVGDMDFSRYDVIGTITKWSEPNGFNIRPLSNFAFIGVACVSAILMLTAIVSMIIGKYPRAFNFVLTLGSALALIAYLIKLVAAEQFVLNDFITLVVLVTIALLNLLLTIIFSFVLNKLDDEVDDTNRSSREI